MGSLSASMYCLEAVWSYHMVLVMGTRSDLDSGNYCFDYCYHLHFQMKNPAKCWSTGRERGMGIHLQIDCTILRREIQ